MTHVPRLARAGRESDSARENRERVDVRLSFFGNLVGVPCRDWCHRKVTLVSNNLLIFQELRRSERTNHDVLIRVVGENWNHGCGTGTMNWQRQVHTKLKGLILAQNERWRRGLGMQVAREPARGTAANGVGMVGDVPSGRG